MQAREAFFDSMDQPGAVGVIDVGERLDARTAERMKARFKKLAAEGQRRHIIDLSRVGDLDSGGLAGLISTLRAVRETGGSIDLVASTSHVKQILELTALTRIFKVHRSVKAALASL
jgi:anti-sigma B factor antagonist